MGHAIEPSSHSVVFEHPRYLSFPAIASVGERLIVIFRMGTGNPLDFDSKILITHSDDNGHSWSPPETWVEEPEQDSRNCGGNTFADGVAHFVYDMHHRCGWRRPYVRFSDDGLAWSEPVRLDANIPGRGEVQVTSIVNQGLEWDADNIYFPCFRGNSVLYNRRTGAARQMPMVPRHEPAIAFNRQRQLVAFSKGGHIDISSDQGCTWVAAADVDTICQPDLIQLADGRLLLSFSGKARLDEWLLLSEDGHDVYDCKPEKIFEGTPDGELDSRGKAMSIEVGAEILTVLYEACGPRGNSRIYLVRTPTAAIDAG